MGPFFIVPEFLLFFRRQIVRLHIVKQFGVIGNRSFDCRDGEVVKLGKGISAAQGDASGSDRFAVFINTDLFVVYVCPDRMFLSLKCKAVPYICPCLKSIFLCHCAGKYGLIFAIQLPVPGLEQF